MPGPPPKPAHERRRRNAPVANTVKLPPGGRDGAPPRWAGPGRLDDRGRRLWRTLWATPMAVAWERLRFVDVVARYVDLRVRYESMMAAGGRLNGALVSALLAELRQLEDRLGLTPLALLRLRWEVDAVDEVGDRRVSPVSSSRSRLKAVDGAVARAE